MNSYRAGIPAAVNINTDARLLVRLERRLYYGGKGCNLQPRSKADGLLVLFVLFCWCLPDRVLKAADFNGIVVQEIKSMPAGGDYSLKLGNSRVARATQLVAGKLTVDPFAAEPTHCSSATYVVFLKTLLSPNLGLKLDPDTQRALLPRLQDDGVGIWGRWNANGPGTAVLFYELNLGSNFTDVKSALPGDFMKISWNGIIGYDPRLKPGQNEKGHSAIFLGTWKDDHGKLWIDFWTGNDAGYIYRRFPPKGRVEGVDFVNIKAAPNLKGYSYRTAPADSFVFIIFSRLAQPANITKRSNLPSRNKYLSDLERRHSTRAEEGAACGITETQ